MNAHFNKTAITFSSVETSDAIFSKINDVINSEINLLNEGQNIQVFIKNREIHTTRKGDSIEIKGSDGDPFTIIPMESTYIVKQFSSSFNPPKDLNWQFETKEKLIDFLKDIVIKEFTRKPQ